MNPAESAGTITETAEKIKRKSGTAQGCTAAAEDGYIIDGKNVLSDVNGVYTYLMCRMRMRLLQMQ